MIHLKILAYTKVKDIEIVNFQYYKDEELQYGSVILTDEVRKLIDKIEKKDKNKHKQRLIALTDVKDEIRKEKEIVDAELSELSRSTLGQELEEIKTKLGEEYSCDIENGQLIVVKYGTNVVMPSILVDSIIYEDRFEHYLKFWDRVLDNPIANVRQQLFDWISNHGLKLTDEGYIIAYRRAESVRDVLFEIQTESVSDMGDAYFFYVGGHYLSHTSYRIFSKKQVEEGIVHEFEVLTKVIPYSVEEFMRYDIQVFTHSHRTASKDRKFFTLNAPYQETNVDLNPENSCSNGLHVGNIQFSFSGFGNTLLACLLCPSKVVSVPTYNTNKLRAYELFPFKVFETIDDTKAYHKDSLVIETDYKVSLYQKIDADLAFDKDELEYLYCSSEYEIKIKELREKANRLALKLERPKLFKELKKDFKEIIKKKNY